jgi:hypothetical protein
MSPEHYKASARRMLCLYLVSRLSDEATVEAFNALADIYSWQIEKERYVSKPRPALGRISLTDIKQLPRNPFVVDVGGL